MKVSKEKSDSPNGNGAQGSSSGDHTNGHSHTNGSHTNGNHTNGNGYGADQNGYSNGVDTIPGGGNDGDKSHTSSADPSDPSPILDKKSSSRTPNGNGNGNGHAYTSGSTNGNGNGSGHTNGTNGYTNGTNGTPTDNTSVDQATRSNNSSTGSGGGEQKESSSDSSIRHTGFVKWFNANTGWGWITRDDPPESDAAELFVHIDDIEANCEEYEGAPMVGLRDGEIVEFNIAPGKKPGQLRAIKVTGPEGKNVIGQAIRGCRLTGEKRSYDDT